MNVYIFKQVSPSLKGPLQLYALHGPMFLFVDRLGFRCPLSVYSQIDIGCGIKIVAVFVSAKNTLSRHQPTNPDPGSVSTTSVQNKQSPAPNASNQNNQSTQTGVKKFSSPKRTPTRLLHHGTENRIQKTSRNIAAIKGPRLYQNEGAVRDILQEHLSWLHHCGCGEF